MKLLIDTNVILDMVLKRSGCDISMELFRKVKEIGGSAYITASSVTDILHRVWDALTNITASDLEREGRVYGGGLKKIEPRELSHVICPDLAELL